MSLRINLNTAALGAHRTLSGTDNRLSKSIEKLSSGFKINSAGDDPAGLVISEKLRAQVSGLGMAIQNAGDAVNMVKTAEGALTEVHRLLRSMRDLALHASNTGATDSASIAADQSQIANAIESINKIATETQFGNSKLLDGTAGVKAQISGTAVVSGSFANPNVSLADDDRISVNVTQAAEKATLNMKDLGTAGQTVGTAGSFTLNGVTFNYEATDTAADIMDKVNAKSDLTGVTASIATEGQVKLETVSYGSKATITATSSATDVLVSNAQQDTGVDVQAEVTYTGSGTGNVSDTTWTAGEGLTLKDSRGNSIVMAESAATTASDKGEQFAIDSGSLTFQVGAFANQTRSLNIQSVLASDLGNGVVTGTSLADIDVSVDAQEAIKVLDKAISDVSDIRARLGATQKNVLESSINSLSIAKENIAASESSIRDTDMAAEMVEFTKNQILQQAGVSMLAQANQSSQALLSLLR